MPVAGVDFKLETKDFDAAVKRFAVAYRRGSEQAIKRVGFELLRRTTLRTTRVDTGRMENGWHVSFHKPSSWVAPPRPKGSKKTKLPDPGDDAGLKTLFVQNNVFYSIYHEFGTSKFRGGKGPGLTPLLMLTKSVIELRGELEKYLSEGLEPAWNREIHGIGGKGLSAEALKSKEEFLKRFEGGSGKVGARRQRRT